MEAPARGSGCSGHLGSRTPCEGGTRADGQVVICQVAAAPAQVGSQGPGDWADMKPFRRWLWVEPCVGHSGV